MAAVRIPTCFDAQGNLIMRHDEGEITILSRKEDSCRQSSQPV
jgi:hypothetical protein